jgi:hypothetical protein
LPTPEGESIFRGCDAAGVSLSLKVDPAAAASSETYTLDKESKASKQGKRAYSKELFGLICLIDTDF